MRLRSNSTVGLRNMVRHYRNRILVSIQLRPELGFTEKYLRKDYNQLSLKILYIPGFQLAR